MKFLIGLIISPFPAASQVVLRKSFKYTHCGVFYVLQRQSEKLLSIVQTERGFSYIYNVHTSIRCIMPFSRSYRRTKSKRSTCMLR